MPGICSDRNDRGALKTGFDLFLMDGLGHLKAIHDWHMAICQHQTEPVGLPLLQTLLAISGHNRNVSQHLKLFEHNCAVDFIILCDRHG